MIQAQGRRSQKSEYTLIEEYVRAELVRRGSFKEDGIRERPETTRFNSMAVMYASIFASMHETGGALTLDESKQVMTSILDVTRFGFKQGGVYSSSNCTDLSVGWIFSLKSEQDFLKTVGEEVARAVSQAKRGGASVHEMTNFIQLEGRVISDETDRMVKLTWPEPRYDTTARCMMDESRWTTFKRLSERLPEKVRQRFVK